MKLLVTGGNGQVGWEIARRAPAAGFKAIALDSRGLDITDRAAVLDTVAASGAAVVINAAAYTAVDKAEQEPARAFAVNRDGPAHLAEACARARIPLIHLSTDYVFAGDQPGAYREDDPIAPLGTYGLSKWQGEQAVRERWPRHLIMRTSWVFGIHGHNFVKTILRLAGEREELRVVDDQYGAPTFAGDIAAALFTIMDHASFRNGSGLGTYHYTGAPTTTWYGFARTLIESARGVGASLAVKALVPIGTADYPTAARRPANAVLDCSRCAAVFDVTPQPWRRSLEQVVGGGLAGGVNP